MYEGDFEHSSFVMNTSVFADKDHMLYFKREYESNEVSYLRLYKYNFITKYEEAVDDKSFTEDHIDMKEEIEIDGKYVK